MVTRTRTLGVALAAVMLVLAGCTGAGGGGGGGGADLGSGDGVSAQAEAGGAAQATASGGDGGGAPAQAAQQRAIIRTGQVAVTVDSFDRSRRNLSRTVEEYGGYVSGSTEDVNRVGGEGGETYTSGQVVFRVPSENFSAFLDEVRAEGRVRRSEVNTEDVTDQLVDIEARLENLRAERDRLRTLYERANETEDVLAVGERLSDVQEEIERLEARKQSLEDRVAMSTLTVQLSEERPNVVIDRDNWYDVGLVTAFLDSVDGVVVTLRALSVALAYALPYLVTFVFLLGGVVGFSYGGYRGLRRVLRGRGGPDDGPVGRPGEAALSPEESDDDPDSADGDAGTGGGDRPSGDGADADGSAGAEPPEGTADAAADTEEPAADEQTGDDEEAVDGHGSTDGGPNDRE
jgi:hypothetical protein